MAVRTHYDVLGVAPDASAETIRAAYRHRARQHHPDRQARSSAAGSDAMPAINEAYRILNDPGRRAIYDRSLGRPTVATGSAAHPGRPTGDARRASSPPTTMPVGDHLPHGPARIPWRTMLAAAVIGTVGVVVLAQFTEGSGELGPDGILRNGDCVEIQPNNDAREIACTGEGDLVVRAFVPFDGTCPGGTEPHRDRQGMGVACIATPAG